MYVYPELIKTNKKGIIVFATHVRIISITDSL